MKGSYLHPAMLLYMLEYIYVNCIDNTVLFYIQGGSNMTGTDLCVNKPHCAAAVRP